MTVDTNTQDSVQPTATLPIPEADQAFNWKDCWYPVAFLQDLPKDRPYTFSLYDEPLVLFRNQDGKLVCLTDHCPHRAAKLSDGQIIDGKIECLYHGWQFGGDGQCLQIPQLPVDAKIPSNACVQSFRAVGTPCVVPMEDGSFRMYYIGANEGGHDELSSQHQIGLAVSDGSNFRKWHRWGD